MDEDFIPTFFLVEDNYQEKFEIIYIYFESKLWLKKYRIKNDNIFFFFVIWEMVLLNKNLITLLKQYIFIFISIVYYISIIKD